MSAPLRAAEQDIDNAHMDNPLVRMTFGEAAWYFMATCEERAVHQIVKATNDEDVPTVCEQAALADDVLNHAKVALRWLRKECCNGEVVPTKFDDGAYAAAWELSELASDYLAFESAYTYASLGLLELQLDGDRIIPSSEFRKDIRFEAYDQLMHLIGKDSLLPDLQPLSKHLSNSIRVNGERFSYPLTPRLVEETMECMGPILDQRFTLPPDWRLAEYTLGEFAQVMKTLWVLSAIHFRARILAAERGCIGLGYSQALILMGEEELNRRVARYTKMDLQLVHSIIADSTYGALNIQSPDPALQFLFRLTSTTIGWAPNLVINSALERNFIVLMNRKPDSQEAYSRMNQQKEELLRSRIKAEIAELGVRFWKGDVSGWREKLDIDLAIISDSEKRCLILELKSFIAPAEAREIHNRSEEIARGIKQVNERKRLARLQPDPLFHLLQVDSSYTFTWAVVSETSIGAAWVQDESVPVVHAGHLIRKILSMQQLDEPAKWLEERIYLPVAGRDYDVVDIDFTIGKWTLAWHGIKELREDIW